VVDFQPGAASFLIGGRSPRAGGDRRMKFKIEVLTMPVLLTSFICSGQTEAISKTREILDSKQGDQYIRVTRLDEEGRAQDQDCILNEKDINNNFFMFPEWDIYEE
jgi:hypothetical protein